MGDDFNVVRKRLDEFNSTVTPLEDKVNLFEKKVGFEISSHTGDIKTIKSNIEKLFALVF